MVKELQGSDYDKLKLSRSILSTMTGDDLKMAKSVKEDAKKQGRDIKIYRNGLGEIGLEENGKDLGVINKKGLSMQDGANLLRDPSNVSLLIPGAGEIIKGASLLSKLVRAGKLAGITAGTDLAARTGADIQNKEGLNNLEENLSEAAKKGALSPVGDIIGSKLLQVAGKIIFPKKIKLEQGEIPLTKGQLTGNKGDLSYETDVAKGVYGDKAREIFDKYKLAQLEKYKKASSRDLPINYDDTARNSSLGSDIQSSLREARDRANNNVKELYSNIDQLGAGLGKTEAKELVDSLENSLEIDARNAVQAYGKDAPEYKAVKWVDQTKKALTENDELNKSQQLKDILTLKKIEQSRRVLNNLIDSAAKNDNLEAVRHLMQQKDNFDKSIANFYQNGKFKGSSAEVDKLLKARAEEADYAKKFINSKTSRNNTLEGQVNSYGAKDIIDLINNPSKSGEDLSKIFSLSNDTKKVEAIDKIRQIAGNNFDNQLREIALNTIFTDIGRVGRGADINMNQTIKNIEQNIEKNNKVIKKLFSPEEIEKIVEYQDILKKMNAQYDVNPSGTASKDIKKGLLNVISKAVPDILGGRVLSRAQDYIINPYFLRRYLGSKYFKQNKQFNNSKLGTLGQKLGVLFSNNSNKE